MEKEKKEKKVEKKLVAKKDFRICFNEHDIKIKKGDDISRIPIIFLENLKTEKVI